MIVDVAVVDGGQGLRGGEGQIAKDGMLALRIHVFDQSSHAVLKLPDFPGSSSILESLSSTVRTLLSRHLLDVASS